MISAAMAMAFKRMHLSWLNRGPFLTNIGLVLVVLAAGTGHAQTPPKPDPSPLAPGDLKHPIFDTRTPVYDKTNAQQKSAGTIVADVDGRTVTLGNVGDAIAELPPSVSALPLSDLYPGVVDRLVRQQALVIRALQQGLDEDSAVRRKVKAAVDQVLANELLHQEISRSITEAALLDRYNKQIAGKPGPDEVHVRVIMAPTEEAATSIINELRAGADFAALAKRSSQDTTAPVGGDIGYVRREGLNAEIGAVAFSVPSGQFTPFPVRSAQGWFIVKVEDRRQGATLAFAEVREQLVQALLREGVVDVVTRALAGVTVREYSINGKEIATPGTN